jgi:hypothetical protein
MGEQRRSMSLAVLLRSNVNACTLGQMHVRLAGCMYAWPNACTLSRMHVRLAKCM